MGIRDSYRGLLAIRRAHPELSGAAGETAPILLALPGWLIGFVLEKLDGKGELAVYDNPETTSQWVEPVSYTHLDVYKRQV